MEKVESNYNKIIAKLNDYNVIPSFSYDTQAKAKNSVKEPTYSDGKYTLTLTDSNKILSDYTFKKTGDVSVSVSGNKITLTSSKAIPDAVVFSATKNMPKVTTTLIAIVLLVFIIGGFIFLQIKNRNNKK